MDSKPFISICIPTYNRADKVTKLVNNILTYKGADIEVLVLDNCSTDETVVLLSDVKDARFKLFKNRTNIGGILNLLMVPTYASGKFAFICLDKDFLDPVYLDDLFVRLKESNSIAFGHCALNSQEFLPDTQYERGFSSLVNMAYRSTHPTGFFYNTGFYKELSILKEIYNENKKFGFYLDIINAEMAFFGNSKVFNLPLFRTETIEECTKIPSYTYNKNNIFFSFNERIVELNMYIKHLQKLGLTRNEEKVMITNMFKRGLNDVTVGYKSIMINVDVCNHYGIAPRKIGYVEMLSNYLQYCFNFIQIPMSHNLFSRLNILFMVSFQNVIHLVSNKKK